MLDIDEFTGQMMDICGAEEIDTIDPFDPEYPVRANELRLMGMSPWEAVAILA